MKIRTEGESAAAQARVRDLLSKPLTVEAAVQVALLNNRALQAAYNDLGVSEAEMIEASPPPSPAVSLIRLTGSGFEIERQLAQNVLALLTLPRRREIAEDRSRRRKRAPWRQRSRRRLKPNALISAPSPLPKSSKYLEDARVSAEVRFGLAKKLGETGAMSKLDQAREHAFMPRSVATSPSRDSSNAATGKSSTVFSGCGARTLPTGCPTSSRLYRRSQKPLPMLRRSRSCPEVDLETRAHGTGDARQAIRPDADHPVDRRAGR